MNGIRKILALVMTALMLAAFAVPAAAQKVYTLNLSPNGATAFTAGSSGASLTATMNNISPDTGNSSVKSFKLFAPAGGGITITAPASGNGVPLGGGYTATIQNNGSSIYVSNIQLPLKPFGPALALNMKVDVACNATGGAWTTQVTPPTGVYQVWNGAGFTGQTFDQRSPSLLTTGVTGACTYSTTFLNQPKKTFAGYPITDTAFDNPHGNPIQVQLTQNGGAPPSTNVTLTSACTISGNTVTTNFTGNTATTNATGVATFTSLKGTAAATSCTLSASFGTSSATSDPPFDLVAPQGTLSCDPNNPNNTAGTLDPFGVPGLGGPAFGLVRGLNTNGQCGVEVPWSLTLDPTNQAFTFTEDSLGQKTSVIYIIRWPNVNKDSDGWSGKQPCVSWGVTDPAWTADATYGCTGDFAPALTCANNNVDSGIAAMPTIPDQPPYNLAGTETQYKYGIDPATSALRKAKVCVVQQGMTVVDSLQVQYWTTFIDQADTVGRMP